MPAASLLIVILATGALLLSACSSNPAPSHSGTPAPRHDVTLSIADTHDKVELLVPARVTVQLPYDVKQTLRWELTSGGAGMSLQSQKDAPPKHGTTGTQVFKIQVNDKGTLPLIFALAPPGPLPPNPKERFSVTLESS